MASKRKFQTNKKSSKKKSTEKEKTFNWDSPPLTNSTENGFYAWLDYTDSDSEDEEHNYYIQQQNNTPYFSFYNNTHSYCQRSPHTVIIEEPCECCFHARCCNFNRASKTFITGNEHITNEPMQHYTVEEPESDDESIKPNTQNFSPLRIEEVIDD